MAFRSSNGRPGSTDSLTLKPDGGASGKSSESQTDFPTSRILPSMTAVASPVSTHLSVRSSTIAVGDGVNDGGGLAEALDEGEDDGKAVDDGSGDADAVGCGPIPAPFSMRIAAAAIATVPETTRRR